MSKLAGKAGAVTIGGSPVLGISSWSIDYKFDVEDSTDFDSSGTSEFIPTISSWSGSFEGFKDGASIAGGAIVAGIFKESQTSTQKWTGNVIITGASPNTPVKGIVSYKYTFQGTGALTVPTA